MGIGDRQAEVLETTTSISPTSEARDHERNHDKVEAHENCNGLTLKLLGI